MMTLSGSLQDTLSCIKNRAKNRAFLVVKNSPSPKLPNFRCILSTESTPE